jgi:CrcB protein
MLTYLLIAVGGALGSVLRYISGNIVGYYFGEDFPYDLLLINALGSFIIGFVAFLPGNEEKLYITQEMRQFIMVGVCGGYTTFSSFSLKTLNLIENGKLLYAGLFIASSVILSLLFVWGGFLLANNITAR